MKEQIKRGLVFTNDRCTGCNKCMKSCGVIGACIAAEALGNNDFHIRVDGERCISCGACFDACEHGARDFEDDTLRFFHDLARGERISVLIAPALRANYPEEYENILGALRAAGAGHLISVSFGADIATWGILKYIKEHDFYGAVSQACPVVVDYIEKYEPGLIPMLMPVQSPLMCSAIYAKTQMGIRDKFAFISPCIAKKIEIDDPDNKGLVSYNVTFDHLLKYLKEHEIKGEPCQDELPYELGAIWPMPGGLAEYARLLAGDDVFIRQIDGERKMIDFLRANARQIQNRETPSLFIDGLNCEGGCLCGTATEMRSSTADRALYQLVEMKHAVTSTHRFKEMSPAERMEEMELRFRELNLNDYLRSYHDKSASLKLTEPTEEELEAVFRRMDKNTEESRKIDCTACGYESCREMAGAIYHGFNRKENCIHYLKNSVENQRQQIQYVAEHDEYLDVYNQRTIIRMIEEFPEDEDYSLIIVDLNEFSGINDTYGYKEGDRILEQFSANLKRCASGCGEGIVARVKADEFLILYPEKTLDAASPEVLAVAEAVGTPVYTGSDRVNMTARIGVVNADPALTPEKNIENAERAMTSGQMSGRTTVSLYGEELKARAEEEQQIRKKLTEMLENNGFYMLYQPQVDVKSGRVTGYEALVRMKDVTMSPAKFIPVAEKNGMIWKIGRITTELVIRQLAAWRDGGESLHPVSINFSSMQLSDEGYPDFLKGLMEKYGVPAELVEIEITESVFVGKTGHAVSLFQRFKDMGITLLMDDFGTGYSSFGYLTYIPVDIIKLDKSLVDNYLVPGKERLLRNLIRLVHDLGKRIIVEGVETREQAQRLRKYGADCIQGYFYSRPLLPEDAVRFSLQH